MLIFNKVISFPFKEKLSGFFILKSQKAVATQIEFNANYTEDLGCSLSLFIGLWWLANTTLVYLIYERL